MESFESLIEILGWDLSKTEKKRKPFAHVFVSLGVQINLEQASQGWISLSNKPGRVESLRIEIDKILNVSPHTMGFHEALSIRGKIAFCEGQTFGRVLAPVARVLSNWAKDPGRCPASTEMKHALSTAIHHLAIAGPRVVKPSSDTAPVVVFTDGACEATTTIGGVIFDGDFVQCFGAQVSESLCNTWKSKETQKQVIGQGELFPLVVARLTWAQRLKGRNVIYFIDNESARLALVKAYSPVLASLLLVSQCLEWDYANQSHGWFARVPTVSNVADLPSRMEIGPFLLSLGATVVSPVFPHGDRPVEILR